MAKFEVKYAADGYKKNGEGVVSIQVRFDRNTRRFVSTGVSVPPDQWDGSRVINNTKAVKLNADIRNKLTELEELEARLYLENRKFTKEYLDNYLKGDNSEELFGDFVMRMIRTESNLSALTIEDKLKTYDRLNEFMPKIRFTRLDHGFVLKFHAWLVSKGYA